MKLTDTVINTATPSEKPYKLTDGLGMYVLVMPNGSKYFRLDYRLNGKRKTVALGVYPDTNLASARIKRDTAKKQIADGIAPFDTVKAEQLPVDSLSPYLPSEDTQTIWFKEMLKRRDALDDELANNTEPHKANELSNKVSDIVGKIATFIAFNRPSTDGVNFRAIKEEWDSDKLKHKQLTPIETDASLESPRSTPKPDISQFSERELIAELRKRRGLPECQVPDDGDYS